jgi:hypothetical protein
MKPEQSIHPNSTHYLLYSTAATQAVEVSLSVVHYLEVADDATQDAVQAFLSAAVLS